MRAPLAIAGAGKGEGNIVVKGRYGRFAFGQKGEGSDLRLRSRAQPVGQRIGFKAG